MRKGVPFRKSHEIVGQIVLRCIERGIELHQLELQEMKKIFPGIGEDVYDWLDFRKSVVRRSLEGGTAPEAVAKAIETAKQELGV